MLPSRIIPKAAVVNDRYEVRGSLGHHGMLEMILAFDRATEQEVVLEIVRLPDDQAKLSWAQGAEEWVSLAQRVDHPNVCRVHGLELCLWGPVVVTEYVTGTSLHTAIRKPLSSDRGPEISQPLPSPHAPGGRPGDKARR